ncbi:Peroxiredoxin [Alteripontixanthobacter maritimus]|uniref:thioredoxin-dependent peroxiredoxin n=1 Tax=Alteripontixanthobacter maritimus TaxID=2161824 RepID=A0A369Q8R0_9SPHN|nr:peroxiredoxin [Alteripontixanthobacter maritimus]RDC61271.1 Peroxiredoxin [Alteripontixanthobacter maritimus]
MTLDNKILQHGQPIPDIAMETPAGGSVSPTEFKGRKLVLFFYPKDNTPGCTTEAKDFTALAKDFAAADTALLGVSKDSPTKHRNFIAKHDLETPLATDAADGGLSDALGIWTEKQMYGKTYMGMVRTTILIAADGAIAQVWNKVRVKGHAAEVLAAAQAL